MNAPRTASALLSRLHRDEGATVTVEWMMVIIVALIVLSGIYYVATWAMNGTSATIDKVTKEKKKS